MNTHNPILRIPIFILTTLCLCISLSNMANASMEPMQTKEFDEFYIAMKISTPPIRNIYIPPIEVTFSPQWINKFKEATSPRYKKYIKKKYAQSLTKALKTDLEKSGWKIVNKPSNTAITLKASLIDLNINAPEQSPGREAILLKNVGSAGVALEYFSPSGAPIIKIIDHDDTPDIVGSPLANRSFNLRYFKLLMANWAHLSTAYIDTLMEEIDKQRKQ